MQKKILSFIIALSLVISTVSSAYAIDISTPQAISFDTPLALNAVRGSALLQAASDTIVAPSASNYVYKYWTGNTIQNVSGSLSTWGGLISPITDSIALSLQSLYLKIYPYIDTIESKFETSNTQVGNIASDIRAIKGYLNVGGVSIGSDVYNINENVHTMKGDLQTLTEAITSGGAFDTVKIANNTDNGFSQSYLWGKYSATAIPNAVIPWFDGRSKLSQTVNLQNLSHFAQLVYRVQLLGNSAVNYFQNVTGAIGAYSLTNDDLTTTSFGSNTSLANDLRNIGSNLSGPLHRLAFVLASQEEIEARQAASDNTSAVVDDFIKPTGSGSASTSDFTDVASIGGTMKDALSSNVGAENAFTSLSSSSEAWNWFSQSVYDSLDSSSTQNRQFLKSGNSDTPLLDAYYSDLLKTLKIK